MISSVAHNPSTIPQPFAEFPATMEKKWKQILEHTQRLYGANHVGLFSDGDDQTWVCFDYRLHHFCIVANGDGSRITLNGDGSRITLNVDDSNCCRRLLLEVQHHYAELLSPGPAN